MRNILIKSNLWDIVRLTSINLETSFKRLVDLYGITTMQGRILSAVYECCEPTIGTISKIIDVSSPNTSNMCKKLEKEGFLERLRSSKDERVVILKLTKKGQDTIIQINNDFDKIYGPIIKNLSDKDIESMMAGISILNKLLSDFENASK